MKLRAHRVSVGLIVDQKREGLTLKIILVAGDVAQSEALGMLAQMLQKRGHETFESFGYGREHPHSAVELIEQINVADWVVVGMSEKADMEVWVAATAREHNIPYAFYADTYGVPMLEAFERFRNTQPVLFVINDDEATLAKTLFPFATIVVTGNPRWEHFAFPKLTRAQAREKLNVSESRRVILSVGDKFLAQNMIQFGATVEAIHQLGWERETDLLLSLHPGALQSPEMYDEFITCSGMKVQIIGKHVGISTGDILPACDLIINFTSTVAVQAAFMRLPTIDFCSVIAMRGKSAVRGRDPWPHTAAGASLPVYGASVPELADRMRQLDSNASYRSNLVFAQTRTYLAPGDPANVGQALDRMCDALRA